MSLPSLSVKRPTAVSMFFLGIILIGIISMLALPVEMMPNTSFGEITINIDVRGGIPASEVEKSISRPVEEAVGSTSRIKNILSISKEGNATIILEFEPDTNMDFAALEVREKFNRIRNKLPPEIEKPVIAKYEYMDVPIIILAVTSKRRTPEQLRKIVDEQIKDRIQRIEGVARVEVGGGREGKIIIEIDQTKLMAYGISINRVVDIINVNNSNLLAGEIKRTRDKYLVRTIGEFQNLEEIKNLSIAATKEGSVVKIRDIATVKDSYMDPVDLARLNSQPVVSIYLQKETTANTVKISKLLQKELKVLRPTIDKDIEIATTSDQAEAIQQAIAQVKSSLFTGAILATIILLIFLRDFRTVFIIASSIPISILLTFYLIYSFKLTLNVMSLSGLALGVGMLVDNAIVVLDNIFKKREALIESGVLSLLSPRQAKEKVKDICIEASDEMFLAIVASTLTTIIVFLPLVFINPEIRMLYSGIALTITYSLLASLLSAITLIPMLGSRLKIQARTEDSEAKKTKFILALESIRKTIAAKLKFNPPPPLNNTNPPDQKPEDQNAQINPLESSEAPPPAAMPQPPIPLHVKIQNTYKKFISICLTLRYPIILVIIACFALALIQSQKLEKEFIGIAEQNKFTIYIELPTGTKLEISDKMVAKVEELTSKIPEVKTATSKIEPWSSKVYIELVPFSKRKKTTQQIIDQLRPSTDKLDPAFIYYEEAADVGTKEILIELYGYNYDILKNLAIQIAQRLQAIPKFTDTKIRMREGRPEMRLNIDKRMAAMFGLTVEEIALSLHAQMRGLVATRYRGHNQPFIQVKRNFKSEDETLLPPSLGDKEENGASRKNVETLPSNLAEKSLSGSSLEAKETETIVRMQERFRKTFADLRRIRMVTPDEKTIYLSQIANFNMDLGPSEIWRKNKLRMIQVSANTGGQALGTAAEAVKKYIKDLKLPKDYFWQFGGNYDKMIRNQEELRFSLLLSLILVYMILAGLFESFTEPFIILFTVPLAAIGAIGALRLTHKPVGMGVLIGAIMLGGIVVNNAIILIDRINFLKERRLDLNTKSSRREVVIIASLDRLRPIMMTSLTTILGLIPLAIDKSESANLWAPLAITVIGGLTVATFFTLFVIPCVYMIFKDLRLIKY